MNEMLIRPALALTETPRRHRMLVGERFGRLTVVKLPPGKHAHVVCSCGMERIVRRTHLTSGDTRSCGCLNREMSAERHLSHGQARSRRGSAPTPEYQAWARAKQRVTNSNLRQWKDYGGRGIAMAAEWLNDFAAFFAHMGPRPQGLTLDRINNDGDYAPGNVRWATRSEQNLNQRARSRAIHDRVSPAAAPAIPATESSDGAIGAH